MLNGIFYPDHLEYLILNAFAILLLLVVAAQAAYASSLSFRIAWLYLIALAVVFVGGARLSYLFFYTNWEAALALKPWSLILYGFSLYGGLIFTFIYQYIVARLAHIDHWYWMDKLTPGIWVYVVLGKLGCLLNGCCFGLPTLMPWGIHYESGSQAYTYYVIQFGQHVAKNLWTIPPDRIHPVQLYESLAALILLAISVRLLRKKIIPGLTFLLTAGLYSLVRLAIFYLRVPASGTDYYYWLPKLYIFISCWSLIWFFIRMVQVDKKTDRSVNKCY